MTRLAKDMASCQVKGDLSEYFMTLDPVASRLKAYKSVKAYKSLEAYEFFLSGHAKPLWFHSIDEDVPLFHKGKVTPSQRLNDKATQSMGMTSKEGSYYSLCRSE